MSWPDFLLLLPLPTGVVKVCRGVGGTGLPNSSDPLSPSASVTSKELGANQQDWKWFQFY